MNDRSGLSRGDRNRNARLARLRRLLPPDHAIVRIDLADDKQAAVVTDHDSRVIARRRVNVRAWELGGLLGWALAKAGGAATAQVNQIRDLMDCAWPAVLGASGSPFRSASWRAALAVVPVRCAGDLAGVRRLGPARFEAAVRRELPRWGAQRPCLRIIRAVFAALSDPAAVAAHRPGALERAHLVLGDWRDTRARLADAEARMVAVAMPWA
jgi:hypothetical protein